MYSKNEGNVSSGIYFSVFLFSQGRSNALVTIPFIHSYSMNSHSNDNELDRIPNDEGIKYGKQSMCPIEQPIFMFG